MISRSVQDKWHASEREPARPGAQRRRIAPYHIHTRPVVRGRCQIHAWRSSQSSCRLLSDMSAFVPRTEEVDRADDRQHQQTHRCRVPAQSLDMEPAIGQISSQCDDSSPQRRTRSTGQIQYLREGVPDDEDADGAHEECYRRQCKHPVCYIPGAVVSRRSSLPNDEVSSGWQPAYQKCHGSL